MIRDLSTDKCGTVIMKSVGDAGAEDVALIPMWLPQNDK
jgi:hypothetical protein